MSLQCAPESHSLSEFLFLYQLAAFTDFDSIHRPTFFLSARVLTGKKSRRKTHIPLSANRRACHYSAPSYPICFFYTSSAPSAPSDPILSSVLMATPTMSVMRGMPLCSLSKSLLRTPASSTFRPAPRPIAKPIATQRHFSISPAMSDSKNFIDYDSVTYDPEKHDAILYSEYSVPVKTPQANNLISLFRRCTWPSTGHLLTMDLLTRADLARTCHGCF